MNLIEVRNESRLLFSIPIYIRSLKKWHEDYKIREKRYLNSVGKAWERKGASMPSNEKIRHEVWFNQSAQLWRYNEIIAFIEIRCYNRSLYGFLFKSEAKRYSPSLKNKKIKPDFSSTCQIKFDSLNIRRSVSQIIDTILKRHRRLRTCFVDTEILDNITLILDLEKLPKTCS